MNSDKCRHTKATHVLSTNFRTGAFRSYHDNGEVFTDLSTLFNNVEAVSVGEYCALLHQWHDGVNHVGVLLVGSEVHNDISSREKLFVATNGETIFSGVKERLTLFSDSFLTQGVSNVEAAITHVKALV